MAAVCAAAILGLGAALLWQHPAAPVDLATGSYLSTILAALEKHLRADGAATRPQVVFVSVDAKRDTPAQLAKYLPYFDPEFVGVTADAQPAIEDFARSLGVAVFLSAPKADGSYSVDHSAELFVIDPAGKLAAIFTGPFTPGALQSDFQRIAAIGG